MRKNTKPAAGDNDWDDGSTIANMNVDGMPWYVRETSDRPAAQQNQGEPLTNEQLRAYRWAAVKAGLLVALVFGAVFFVFIAFCDFIWFR